MIPRLTENPELKENLGKYVLFILHNHDLKAALDQPRFGKSLARIPKMHITFKKKKSVYLNVPQPELRAVVRTAGDQVNIIRTPGKIRHTVRVTLQSPHELQLMRVLCVREHMNSFIPLWKVSRLTQKKKANFRDAWTNRTMLCCVSQTSSLTGSTCQIITVVSFEPVASLVPSLENLQNHTSLQCSVRICCV